MLLPRHIFRNGQIVLDTLGDEVALLVVELLDVDADAGLALVRVEAAQDRLLLVDLDEDVGEVGRLGDGGTDPLAIRFRIFLKVHNTHE
jgi:hypothetical protein